MNLGGEPPIVIETTRRVVHVEFAFDDGFAAVQGFKLCKHRRILANDIRHRE